MNRLTRFAKDETAATAIEYGLIAAAMGVVLVAVMPFVASAIMSKFASIAGHISSGT